MHHRVSDSTKFMSGAREGSGVTNSTHYYMFYTACAMLVTFSIVKPRQQKPRT